MDNEPDVDWSTVDPELLEGNPVKAIYALGLQGLPMSRAIGLVDERATMLMDQDPAAFKRPPPWPGVYT